MIKLISRGGKWTTIKDGYVKGGGNYPTPQIISWIGVHYVNYGYWSKLDTYD